MLEPKLTDEELLVVNLLADIWNMYCALPVQHPEAATEFMYAIHQAQSIVMNRLTVRCYPDVFVNMDRKGGEVNVPRP